VVNVAVKVKVLQNWGRETALRRKWMQMWEKLGKRILKMPKWMQDMILDDINTAIKNRIAVMEMINNANRENRA